jgi:hypothetical protein
MMYTNMPLQVIWSRIFVFAIWTEWTHITRRVVHKAVPYHLVLSLEALATFAAWAARYRTVMWTIR